MRQYVALASIVCAGLVTLNTSASRAQTPSFDFDAGNAAIDVIIPAVIPALFQTTTPNDAPLVLRHTTLITNAWFDAIAPYHPTAVGVYSRLGRRPAADGATNRNKNVAIFYASYRILNSLMPRFAATWQQMLASAGLNPNDASTDLATAVGIGNVAGAAVAAARERDGMNQLGDEAARYNRRPYEDYTGYVPVNTPWLVRNPSRWQPIFTTPGNGTFHGQQFVTPQWSRTRPYSYTSPVQFNVQPPSDSDHRRREAYKAQADEVMAVQVGLTDYQKMVAELFDNKISSLGFAALFISVSRGFSLDQFVHYDFLTNLAAFDTGIATWNEKVRFDAVRPVTAIRFLYGGRTISGWAGPGRGIVNDLPGGEWRSYLNTGNHPEYPSGSASFCAAHAQASRRYLGSDAMGWSVPIVAGASAIEPGVTPAANLVLGPWPTFTAFEQECALSRVWGGVHFTASLAAGQQLGRPIGDLAFAFVDRHLRGQVQ